MMKMTEALSVAPQVDNNVSILEKALDWVGQGQTAWGLLILFMCIIDAVYKRIDFLCSDSSKIPENIKMMLILIFALSPSEWYWEKTGEPIVFENALYDYVASKLQCHDVKLAVQDLKERKNSTTNGVNRLMDFLSGIYGK